MRERFIALTFFFFLGLLVIFLRCWDLQIRSEKLFEMKARRNQLRSALVPAERGKIVDRRGKVLIASRQVFDVQVLDNQIRPKEGTLRKMAEILALPVAELDKKLKKARSRAYFLPVTLMRDIGRRTNTVLLENRIDLPDVVVTTRPIRHYPYETFGSHILGYVGKIDEREWKKLVRSGSAKRLGPDHLVGKSGLEKAFDSLLQGTPGVKRLRVDVLGWPVEERLAKRPRHGHVLETTLDLEVQTILERALEGKVGAVVAVDPATGDVLGMASYPSFDLNLFTRAIAKHQWEHLVDPEQAILLNRAVEAAYQPGSTFKIVTALASLETEAITTETSFRCKGRFKIGKRTARCWKTRGHGSVRLTRAIAKSCNVYFYQAGLATEGVSIIEMALSFGLGQRTGITLPGEIEGVVPTPEWIKKNIPRRDRTWSSGDTVNLCIGQGELLVTPLQMAMLLAAIENEGQLMKPRLVRRVMDAKGRPIREYPPVVVRSVKVSPASLKAVKKGLVAAVRAGTARRARLKGVRVYGKTGSAQNPGRRTHAWFIGVMETGSPSVALAVLLENAGSGGGQAVPVAREILGHILQYFKSIGAYPPPLPKATRASTATTSVTSRDPSTSPANPIPDTPPAITVVDAPEAPEDEDIPDGALYVDPDEFDPTATPHPSDADPHEGTEHGEADEPHEGDEPGESVEPGEHVTESSAQAVIEQPRPPVAVPLTADAPRVTEAPRPEPTPTPSRGPAATARPVTADEVVSTAATDLATTATDVEAATATSEPTLESPPPAAKTGKERKDKKERKRKERGARLRGPPEIFDDTVDDTDVSGAALYGGSSAPKAQLEPRKTPAEPRPSPVPDGGSMYRY